jgi:hypothetical protein
MPFLSLLDDRAKPKGSRDPLGFELVWTHYGRQVISNLTTVTSSLSNFAVALLGFHWANEINAHLPAAEKSRRVRETFLRYEQMAGYLRYLADDKELMGITRVSARMEDVNPLVSFGMRADEQILSDQASYGLWGLYSTASAESGIIKGDIRLPTELGRELAEEIERALDKPTIVSFFTGEQNVSREQLAQHAKAFLKAISKKSIRRRLLDALMKGGDHHAVQSDLWAITEGLADKQIKVDSLADFIVLVKRQASNPVLVSRLEDIEAVERILVAANNLFNYCRRQEGESLDSVLNEIGDRYHYGHLPERIDLSGVPRGALLQSINLALHNNDTAAAIGHILELNKLVMEQRSGAPWVEVEPSKIFRVRVPSETYSLRNQQELESNWDYEYFISSFLQIASRALGAQWKVQ